MTLAETSDVLQGRWTAYVMRRLDELERGEGRELWEGTWPGPEVVQAARRLALETFPPGIPAPAVVPTAEGRVAFLWASAGWWAESEVTPDGGEYWALQMGQDGATIEGNMPEHSSIIRRLLRGLDGMAG
jgi:hypothetical protein